MVIKKLCVACNTHLQLDPVCTGLTPAAVNGIKYLGLNCLLVCNNCVENEERAELNRCITIVRADDQIEGLNFEKKMKMGIILTGLIETKNEDVCKKSCEKIAESYAAVAVKNRMRLLCHARFECWKQRNRRTARTSTSQTVFESKEALRIQKNQKPKTLCLPMKKSNQ